MLPELEPEVMELELVSVNGAAADPARVGGRGGAPTAPGQDRRTHPVGRRILAVAAVLAVVAAGALALSRGRAPSTTTAGLPERSLAELATIAAAQPDRPLGPGQYDHQERESGSLAPDGRWSVVTDTFWTAVDGTGRQVHTVSVRPAGSGPDQAISQPPTSELMNQAGAGWFGFSYDDHRAAPTDGPALRAVLEAEVGPMSSPGDVAIAVASLLADPVTPPEVRAAGLRLLQSEGFVAIGPVQDPSGRQNLGFSLYDPADGVTQVVTIDPATAAVTSVFTVIGQPVTIRGADAVRWNGFLDSGVTTQDR